MEKDLGDYRKSYEKGVLLETAISDNPMELFQKWFHEVDTHFQQDETNAMTLSTLGLDGYPKNRVVLLKKYDFEGFIFYTNYESEKGKAMDVNPNVCLSFHWAAAERQIIIKGASEKIAANLSDGYFESRPKVSQLGAIASRQSSVIRNREILEEKLKSLELEYESKNDGAQVSLNLKNPLEVGIYKFFLEGAKLMDGSLVDRAYLGDVKIGS